MFSEVTRKDFDEVMLPCYNPLPMILLKVKAHVFGTSKIKSISTSLVVLR